MSHIFFSYAREDRARAELLAAALQQEGWSVWWDRNIPAGRTFDEVIEQALDAAACVVVLWSEQSITNHWVRSEADEGALRGALVPVLLEHVRIPLAFRRIQAADLVEWNGDRRDPNYLQLLADIATLLGRTPGQKAASTHESPAPVNRGPARNVPDDTDTGSGVPVRATASAPKAEYLQIGLKAQMVAVALTGVATLINVESIVVSTPTVAALGVILVVFGVRDRSAVMVLAGACGPALGILCWVLISHFSWSPSDAQAPLATITVLWAIPYLFFLLRLARRQRT
jgi:hypothetical protein